MNYPTEYAENAPLRPWCSPGVALAVVLLAVLVAPAPTSAKKVICVDDGAIGEKRAFNFNHEGWEREHMAAGDVIQVGGNLTTCLDNAVDGDEIIIIAHGVRTRNPQGKVVDTGFNWGRDGNGAPKHYTGFGGGANEMPVPADFAGLDNVTVKFCSCYSALTPEGGISVVDDLVGKLGGGGNSGTGFTGVAKAGMRVAWDAPSACAARDAAEALAKDKDWETYPPANRPDSENPDPNNTTQQTAGKAVVDKAAKDVNITITYKEPVEGPADNEGNRAPNPAAGEDIVWGCSCDEGCGIGTATFVPPIPGDPTSAWNVRIHHNDADRTCLPNQTPVDTFHLAWWSFDSGAGVCDAQGWITVDNSAFGSSSFGDFGALHSGITVLQEDACFTNFACLWAWFDPVGGDYICPGPPPTPVENHPGTKQVPFGPDAGGGYLDNEIWSPLIPCTGPASATGSSFKLEFDVYRDLAFDNLVFYTWRVRSFVAGTPTVWRDKNWCYYGDGKDWIHHSQEIGDLLVTGADSIQVALGVRDMCGIWCGILGSGTCHSHGPLFDNVYVLRINTQGPVWDVRQINLFQDNFAEDGTLTGHVRADAAIDIAPRASMTILPGDSVVVCVTDKESGIAPDSYTGIGPAVYCYVTVWPKLQAGKSGPDIEASETRGPVGKRYPLVDSLAHDGTQWYCFRMDTAFCDPLNTIPTPDRYCFDLNDWVLNPCDTVCFVFCAENNAGFRTYWSEFTGTTPNLWAVLDCPMEFTCLPAGGWKRGGDILYVDHFDGRGVQPFFDTALGQIGILGLVDRYDVRGPSSLVNNSLASRVQNLVQLTDCYRKIIWNTGDLPTGLIGDGTGTPLKSDDYGLLASFLDDSPAPGGLYFSGDDIHQELAGLTGASAIDFRTRLYTYSLVNGRHVDSGEAVSPLLTAVGACFVHGGVPDQLIAFGGCPLINAFDVMNPTGTTATEFQYPNSGNGAVLSSSFVNTVGQAMGIIGSGFSYHYIRDKDPTSSLARSEHLVDILRWLGNVLPDPVGIDPTKLARNALGNAYPNPFNPTTTIDYSIKDAGHVSLKVYNVAGQLVRTLVNGVQTPKAQSDFFKVTWDGRNNAGQPVSSGVYFYKLVAANFVQTKKMVFLK